MYTGCLPPSACWRQVCYARSGGPADRAAERPGSYGQGQVGQHHTEEGEFSY